MLVILMTVILMNHSCVRECQRPLHKMDKPVMVPALNIEHLLMLVILMTETHSGPRVIDSEKSAPERANPKHMQED